MTSILNFFNDHLTFRENESILIKKLNKKLKMKKFKFKTNTNSIRSLTPNNKNDYFHLRY